MKNIKLAICFVLAVFMSSCDKTPVAFEMTVENVVKLNGLLLKGVSFSGIVSSGCIAEGTPYTLFRNNKKVFEDTARILSVSNHGNPKPPNGEAIEKELVSFYVPGIDIEQILAGDLMTASVISCRKTSLAKLK